MRVNSICLRLTSNSTAADFAWEFAGEIEIVVDDVFEVDTGDACVGKERVEVRFALVVFVL